MGWSAVTVSVLELRRKSIAAPAEVSIASKASKLRGAPEGHCYGNSSSRDQSGGVVIGLVGLG
jgi:hypothetical protein